MKTRRKIILIGGTSVVIVVIGIFLGPVIHMIIAIQYSGLIISSTPDEIFEKEFNDIPEVELFIEKISKLHYIAFTRYYRMEDNFLRIKRPK